MHEPAAVQQQLASVQEAVAKLFLARLELDVPSAETDLFETGVLDSLSFVDLLLGLEQEFGVKVAFDDLEIEHFRTVQKIAALVVRSSATASFG